MSEDCRGTWAMREIRPSHRLKLLYRIYLLIIVWLLVLPLLIPVVLFTTPTMSLFFSVPVLIMVLFTLYWIPKFYSSILFIFTDREIIIKRGIWIQQTSTVPFSLIKNIEITQGWISRSLGFSDLRVHTTESIAHGESSAKRIRGIENPDELRELIMERIRGCAEPASR